MKIVLAQLNYHIGNFESNIAKIIRNIEWGKQQGADLVVFAELAICGYPPRDFLEFDDFVEQCNQGMKEIARSCQGIAAIVGGPSVNPVFKGKNLYNSAYFLADGEIVSMVNKSLLPNYDVFDEYRYFEPNKTFDIIEYKGKKIALTICEDLWDIGENRMYTIQPMDELMKFAPHLMVNIAASPFSYRHPDDRKNVLSENAKRYGLPVFYVNHVGAQTELIFDGGSLAINAGGEIADELNYFSEDTRMYELNDSGIKPLHQITIRERDNQGKMQLIHDALVLGIRDYFGKLGFRSAIFGLSGGIDSAIVAVLAARALGSENVHAMLMPSMFSSDHSVSDSEILVANLGIHHHIVPIEPLYNEYEKTLAPLFKGLPFNIAEENLQARIRGALVMAMTNKFGHILLNTTNKSEAAVGYGTLYGDLCGGLSVIGDVYKTEVYDLARYINRDAEIIPTNIITKAPSAELRHNQKDSDSLPEYDILDSVLYQYIEQRRGPREIIAAGFDENLVRRILKLVNISEFKRQQTPPILRVSSKAFGMGRRMPIVGKYLS